MTMQYIVQNENDWSVTLDLTTGQNIVFGKEGKFNETMVDEIKAEFSTALIDLYGVDKIGN